jgi:hypothetical protein
LKAWADSSLTKANAATANYDALTLQKFLYSTGRKMPYGEGCFVYSDNLVRQLCSVIAAANDPEKANDLVSLLQAVIKEDQEEIRIRMAFLAKKYADIISGSNAAD